MKWLVYVLIMIWASETSAVQALNFSTLSRGTAERDYETEEVVRGAYRLLGITIEVSPLPGKRALRDANSGLYDGELRRSRVDPVLYPNLVKIPSPVGRLEICAFTTGLKIQSKEDLSQHVAGALLGGKKSKAIAQLARKSIEVNTVNQLVKLLVRGRIDVVIGNCLIFHRQILNADELGIVRQQPELLSIPLFHYINKKHILLKGKILNAIIEYQNN